MLIQHKLSTSEVLFLSHYHVEIERIIDTIIVIVLNYLFESRSREGLSDESFGEKGCPLVPLLELLVG